MTKISTSQSRPLAKLGKRAWIWILILVLALVGGGYAYFEQVWRKRPASVSVEIVSLGTVSQVLAVNGRVASSQTVNIRSLVAALVVDVAVEEGDAVNSGDLLVQLDASQPEALIDQAQAAFDTGLVQQRQAQANFDRAEALGEFATRAALEDAERSLISAGNEVMRLQAVLDQARDQLAHYTINAPFSGVVLNRDVDRGQLVDTQIELFTIANLDQLVVEADVDEIYSARIQQGLKTLLKPAGDSVIRDGTVSFVAPTVDLSTGGRAVRIAFDQGVDLPIGLTVNVNIIVSEATAAISASRGAILTEGSQSHVLVITDGRVAVRPVVFDDWPAERVLVLQGLAPGDSVILDPASVTTGQAVEAE